MKIHLIDGTYELFRNHFGAPPKKSPDGQEVGATLGLLRSLLMLLTSPGVTHVAVAFDHVIESFRNELYDGYKTSEGVDPQLLAQFPLAEAGVSALGVVVWPMIKFEADDAMGDALDLEIAAVACVVVDEHDGGMSTDEELLQRQDLSPVSEGFGRQHAHFRKRVNDDARGSVPRDLFDDALYGVR